MLIFYNLLKLFLYLMQPSNVVSFDMETKTLEKGKVVRTAGEVFYRNSDGMMVTKFSFPYEYYVFVNGKGEMKMYDPKYNSVMLRESKDLSSENSFFFQYLKKGGGDLGLSASGYKVSKTRKNGNVIVTEWVPAGRSDVSKVELAMEKNLPIAMFIYNNKNQVTTKTYYSGFIKVGGTDFPSSVTDITFKTKTDSVIAKRWYKNPKTGSAVDLKYFSFKIPEDAKVFN